MLQQTNHIQYRDLTRRTPFYNECRFQRLNNEQIFVIRAALEDDIYDLFNRSKIILSIESGVLIEGISAAIPAIVLYNPEKYSHNPLPSKGRSVVWDSANNEHDVERLIEKFNHKLVNEKEKLLEYAKTYKEMFFCEPTDEKIIDSFDL